MDLLHGDSSILGAAVPDGLDKMDPKSSSRGLSPHFFDALVSVVFLVAVPVLCVALHGEEAALAKSLRAHVQGGLFANVVRQLILTRQKSGERVRERWPWHVS